MIQSKMTKQEKDYQEAVWELLKSELLYMEKLKVLSDVFLTSLEEIQKEGILVEVSIERLFGNLRAVCQAHLTFWLDHLQPVLERARENKQLINAIDICDAFLQVCTKIFPVLSFIIKHVRWKRKTMKSLEWRLTNTWSDVYFFNLSCK